MNIQTLRQRATKFAKEYANTHYEIGEAQSFIIDFYKIFDLTHCRAVSFESALKN